MNINDKVFIVLYNLILNIDNKNFNKIKNLDIYKKKEEKSNNNIYYIILICFISIFIVFFIIYLYIYKRFK